MAERVVKVRLSAQIAEYQRGMADAARSTRDVGTEAQKLAQKREAFQGLGRTAVVMGTAMAALGYAVAKTGIEYNTLQQKSRAALTTLLGGAEAANAQMDKLDAFARTSPFSKAVFIQAQQQMLGFGVAARDVIPALDAIQNAVAAMGGGNDQIRALAEIIARIKSEGRLSGDALQRLGYYGIDAATIIGSQMNKTAVEIRDMASKPGGIPVEQIWNPLVNGLEEKFGGAAANVKNTMEGALDRVSAAWRDLSADLMKPLVDPSGGGALVGFLNWTADLLRAFGALPEPIKVATGATYALVTATLLLGGSWVALQPKIAQFKVNVQSLGWSMGALKLSAGLVGVALTAMTAILLAVGAAQQRAKQLADEYSGAMEQGEGSVRKFIAAQLAAKDSFLFMDLGSAVENADRLGISMEEVSAAVTGSGDDFDIFRQRVQDAWEATGRGSGVPAAAVEQLVGKVRDLRSAEELAESQAENTEVAHDALGGELDETATAAAAAKQALDDMSDALSAVGREAMTASEAVDKAQGAVNKLQEAAEAEGVTLDGTNDASLRFRDAIRDVESSHRDAAEAILKNGGSLEEARTEYGKGREAVLKMLEAKGLDRAEAVKWADENLGRASEVEGALKDVKDAVDDIPDKKAIDLTANTNDARARVREFIREYDGKTIHMTLKATQVVVQGRVYGGLRDGSYRGNLFEGMTPQHFASGGMRSGIYAGVQGGIFAEAERGVPWEAFISGRAADRDRNIGIWLETGRRLGAVAGGGQADLGVLVERLAEKVTAAVMANPKVTFVNPTMRDPERDAWEAAQIAGG